MMEVNLEEFSDDQTLGLHWIYSHNKEAQWPYRGLCLSICLTGRFLGHVYRRDSVLSLLTTACLFQCIPCGSHLGNLKELWPHTRMLFQLTQKVCFRQ